jgi:hypothetical protein
LIYMQQEWCKQQIPRFARNDKVSNNAKRQAFVIPSARCWHEESAVALHGHDCRLVLLVRAFEIGDLVIALEVPDTCGNFIDEIMIVGHK